MCLLQNIYFGLKKIKTRMLLIIILIICVMFLQTAAIADEQMNCKNIYNSNNDKEISEIINTYTSNLLRFMRDSSISEEQLLLSDNDSLVYTIGSKRIALDLIAEDIFKKCISGDYSTLIPFGGVCDGEEIIRGSELPPKNWTEV